MNKTQICEMDCKNTEVYIGTNGLKSVSCKVDNFVSKVENTGEKSENSMRTGSMADLSPSILKGWAFSPTAPETSIPVIHDISQIERIAAELSIDIVVYSSGLKQQPVNKYALTMRRCVDEMLIKHEILFNGMVNKLHITRENVHLTFTNVVNELFRDGEINWGRVVSVYAFAARLARHLDGQNEDATAIQNIATICGEFVAFDLGGWIEKQGGWVSLL